MMISTIDTQLGTLFIGDETLFNDLCMHLKATVFRLQKEIYYKKTSHFQLADDDAYLYDAVAGASRLYWEICGVVPDEEELVDICCYLLLSIRRNRRRLKALLICSCGIAKRIEFMETIEKILPSVDVVECCSANQLRNSKIRDYDFIVSMENVPSHGKPVVDLSMVDRKDYTAFILQCLEKSGLSLTT